MLSQSPPHSDVTPPANLHHLTLPKQCQPLEANIQIAEPMGDISQLNHDTKELLMGRQAVTSPDCLFFLVHRAKSKRCHLRDPTPKLQVSKDEKERIWEVHEGAFMEQWMLPSLLSSEGAIRCAYENSLYLS